MTTVAADAGKLVRALRAAHQHGSSRVELLGLRAIGNRPANELLHGLTAVENLDVRDLVLDRLEPDAGR